MIQQTRRNISVLALGLASNAVLTSHMAWAPGHTTVARSASRTSALTGCHPAPVWKSKFYGAFVLNRRVDGVEDDALNQHERAAKF